MRNVQLAGARRHNLFGVADGAQNIPRQGRDLLEQGQAEEADQRGHQDDGRDDRVLADVGQPLAKFSHQVSFRFRFTRDLVAGARDQQADDHEDEADPVQQEDGPLAAFDHDGRGQHGAEHATEVEGGGLQGDGAGQGFAAREFDEHGLTGGDLDRAGSAEQECDQGDVPDLNVTHQGQRGEDESQDSHDRLEHDDRPAFVPAFDQHARGQGQ